MMLPRLQAEEQLAAIMAGRVAQGAGDEKGRAAIEQYTGALERQREGLPQPERKAAPAAQRRQVAEALGMETRSSGRTYNPLGAVPVDATP